MNNTPVGQHPRICQLMTGIFNKNPPKPRYNFVWDVEQVLVYLNKLSENVELSDRVLTLKLSVLLALTSACRVSEIKYLDTRYMIKSHTSVIFQFSKITKSWRRGKAPPKLEFHAFPPNKKLCVVQALEEYLKRSQPWRSNEKHQLLLSPLKPHREVVNSTISGWVKLVLKEAGIDTTIFKAHSCRSASSFSFSYYFAKNIFTT